MIFGGQGDTNEKTEPRNKTAFALQMLPPCELEVSKCTFI